MPYTLPHTTQTPLIYQTASCCHGDLSLLAHLFIYLHPFYKDAIRLLSYSLGYNSFVVATLCPTFCDRLDCSLPGSSVHGPSQARTLEWAAMPSSGGSSQAGDGTQVSCTCRWLLYDGATKEAPPSITVLVYFGPQIVPHFASGSLFQDAYILSSWLYILGEHFLTFLASIPSLLSSVLLTTSPRSLDSFWWRVFFLKNLRLLSLE